MRGTNLLQTSIEDEEIKNEMVGILDFCRVATSVYEIKVRLG
jgi:hypothetical protein